MAADEAGVRVIEQIGQGEVEPGDVDQQQECHDQQRQAAPEQEIEGTRRLHQRALGEVGPRQSARPRVSNG
ncbi:hypothetical protein D3C78_1759410 [compost metagenome]